nr:hypothetical protein [uncultured Draconibacterium sp.]
MIKTIQTQVRNEYQTQIKDLEENLNAVGNFEAIIKKNKGGIKLKLFINYLFSYTALFLAVLIFVIVQFFFDKLLGFLRLYFELSQTFFSPNSTYDILSPRDVMIVLLYSTCLLLLVISLLLRSLRVKNRLIIKINIIVSDLKQRVLSMLDVAKNRQKTYSEHVAREQATYSKEN